MKAATKEKQDAKKEEPHYHGHRDRLRQRFLEGGPDALPDYEFLELLLFMAIPRRDTKKLAKDLLARFGTLAGVINAPVAELRETGGLSTISIAALKTVQVGAHRLLKQEIMQQPVLNSWQRLVDYCRATMGHETKENFRILFLNRKNELIKDEIHQTGTIDHTPAYPREIIKRTLEVGATALILVHNHPSGDSKPSEADIDLTYAIKAAAEPFNIMIHDHIVVSKNGTDSFKSMGLL